MMKWLTLGYIKQHSRIDYDLEDGLLELYGESAETVVLNYVGRTYEGLVAKYGAVPMPLVQASLMLVDLSYMQRSAVSMQQLYAVPYTFDLLVKPYMRLADEEEESEETGSGESESGGEGGTALNSAGTTAAGG
jgi:uncharacterized phage protein (predicted DNA packaging)